MTSSHKDWGCGLGAGNAGISGKEADVMDGREYGRGSRGDEPPTTEATVIVRPSLLVMGTIVWHQDAIGRFGLTRLCITIFIRVISQTTAIVFRLRGHAAMTRQGQAAYVGIAIVVALATTGCGTTRMTDSQRAATEMILVSQAIDQAIAHLDFSPLDGQHVFLDTQYLDGTVDRGYIISTLRQELLMSGALLQEDRKSATVVVEPRSGGVGTDRNSLLVGTSQMSLPSVMPGQPTQIPEVALIKKTDQRGIAKLAVFAYNRNTGKALWQSGLVEGKSTVKDTWVFGAGPFSRGSIRRETELAGEPLPKLAMPFSAAEPDPIAQKPKPVPPAPLPPPTPPVLPTAGSSTPAVPTLPLGPPSVTPLP